ncbi:MAG: RNA 2',3'-cyclic phosphodiesterase [Candidatus Latescibacteria bacterium]|nr:RNA 2',3'-cyclic phosphodiesterase [Candidatus Latescibacterota bacterium]NIM21138.1 RNA 2',3'-cyclic phosphodiesterase [Candidatus Latescibacterota bacterium]NIM65273.1 RNA 2',3'-cyclic phosphodiesterase [Candidatus Latescibacterota bacterium]NIO01788.1 RNA 2',3'-cyclic phosphodiesterase [Candidatus Latescibacterota bacterium]NIO28305.1 RNA 2',3'-cyclic phosphodiesterase [Candidatus Latescibacterota bacterium]
MRLFIAVNLTSEVKLAIRKAIDHFPISDPPWRWVKEDALHITLKFLGETPENHIPKIATHLEQVCSTHSPFSIELADLSGFPNLTRPRVLFFRIEEGAEGLEQLSTEINSVLEEEMNMPKEEKRFRAHITVARVKQPIPHDVALWLTEVPALSSVSQTVHSVDLMKSELRREGARYHIVKEIALKS